MSRRVSNRRARLIFIEYAGHDEPASTADTVHEDEEPGFTGVYDRWGEPIFREKIPFGFVGSSS